MAMNLSHEAKMSKTKGDDTAYVEQMTKAFFLEKEAALKVYEDTTVWKHALIRSAGWLAFKSGLFSDALDLVQFGKKGNPPQYLKHELSELEQAITQKLGETSSKSTTQNLSQIFGFLISANIPKSQIEIQKDEHSSITIQVPADKINDIVRIYWGQAVEIQGIEQQNGIFKMSAIKRAA